MTERTGIAAGGNWIVDHVKTIDVYPQESMLTKIRAEQSSNGGSAYNVLKDLALLNPPWPLQGIGLLGKDDLGKRIVDDCKERGIDTRLLQQTTQSFTSYTDVMTVASTGVRTFFQAMGANALLAPEHFSVADITAKICHVGYHLLLDRLDALDAQYGTVMGRLFYHLSEAGIITSLDVVSEDSTRYKDILPKTLPYTDILFINEVEAERTLDMCARTENGAVNLNAVKTMGAALCRCGVRRYVIIHMPEGALVSTVLEQVWYPALQLPPDFVVSTVGAGDAFCAGALYGMHEEWNEAKWVGFAHALAAASLRDSTCSNGIQSFSETMSLYKQYKQ